MNLLSDTEYLFHVLKTLITFLPTTLRIAAVSLLCSIVIALPIVLLQKISGGQQQRVAIARALAIASERQLSAVPAFRPGVPEILAFFREKGVKMAVASSSTREVVGHNLEASGILPYFDAVVTGEDVVHGKPAPDIFLRAAERLGLPAAFCTVYEDALSGIRAAHAAGCRPVMIPDQVQPTPEIRGICTVRTSFLEELAALREDVTRG